jgi:hypothetical protein
MQYANWQPAVGVSAVAAGRCADNAFISEFGRSSPFFSSWSILSSSSSSLSALIAEVHVQSDNRTTKAFAVDAI